MAWTNRRRGGGGRPKRRGLTAAQQAAHDKAYEACDHTVEGRYAKGQVVMDHRGDTWQVVTYGIAYHEDVSSRLYGVRPCRGPKGYKETRELRQAIEQVRGHGAQAPGSRAGDPSGQQPRPDGAAVATWRDGRPGSLASFPTLTIYEGGVVGVCCPIYDDSPVVAWVRDARFAGRLLKAIAACPEPVPLPEAEVRERKTRVKIDPASPRHAAYAEARGARSYEGGIEIPSPEYRRIKAALDAAEQSTPADPGDPEPT